MKYRSKPVEVEAVQFNDDSSYMKMEHKWGLAFTDACSNAIPWCRATDWIIKDGDTFSVCSDEEFQRKYAPLMIGYECSLFPMQSPEIKQGEV